MQDCNARAHTKTSTNQLIKQIRDDYCHLPTPEEIEVRLFLKIVSRRDELYLVFFSGDFISFFSPSN